VRRHLLLSTIFALTFGSATVSGCTCVSSPPGIRSARDLAQWTGNKSDAIFEGTVQRIELKWPLSEAKAGDLISADIEQDPPIMQVSFEVVRAYRGRRYQKSILIRTGVGGDDCGFHFEVGEQYLVYAFANESGQLSTGICSGTAMLEESQANLSYRPGEPVVSETVERNRPISSQKLCGRAIRIGSTFADSQVFFLRVGSKSPIPAAQAELAQEGSFCATGVMPGKYHLLFVNRAEDSPTSFVLFPGAHAIELEADRWLPDY
jgi:hypothetical protein